MKSFVWRFRSEVRRVIDGDTIEVYVDLGFNRFSVERVRLLGIDCDETRGRKSKPTGLAATLATRAWIAEAEVQDKEWSVVLVTAKGDAFGRWLALVYRTDGNELGRYLVDQGLAKEWGE